MYPFHIFGSSDSLDYDVVLFVPALCSIRENHQLCDVQALPIRNRLMAEQLPEKKLNLNAAVIGSGVITQVYKGTPDELNNAVLRTYPLHPQFHPLLITQTVARNWQLKMLRVCRTILSFYTRTPLRPAIKQALQGDLDKKISMLEKLDLTQWTQFDKNNPQDCWKTIAFQLGQAMGLFEGVELYTKEEISQAYPQLDVFLQRRTQVSDLTILETEKSLFIRQLKVARPLFTRLLETDYL